MIYAITIILSVGVLFLTKKFNSKRSKIIIYGVSFLIMLLPHGLRYGIGTDYFYTYVPYFNWIGKGEKYFTEIGFNVLNWVVYKTTRSYKVLFFVCSLISFAFIYAGIIGKSKNENISFLIVYLCQYYFYSMNMVRQSVAIAIIFYAYTFLKKDKYIIYSLFCLLAASMHISALIMIPIGLLSKIKYNKIFKMSTVIGVALLSPIIGKVAFLIVDKFTNYGWYFDSSFAKEQISVLLVFINVILFALTIYYEKQNEEDDNYKKLSNFNYFAMLMLMLSTCIPLIYRLVRYLTIFQVLLIPEFISSENRKVPKRLLSCSIIVVMLSIMIYQIMILGGEEVYPYRSIFNI